MRASGALSYLEDLVCQQAVRVAVDLGHRFSIGRLREAEDLASPFVVPVPNESHPVARLHVEIVLVRGGGGLSCQPLNSVVNIEEQRHAGQYTT